MAALTWVDYCIVGIVGLSGLISLTRGLVQELFSLMAWGAAIWVGLRYSRGFSAYLESAIPLPSARVAAAFAILFAAILGAASLAAFLLNKLIRGAGLAGADRLAGLAFGIARGALVVAVLVLGAGATPLARDPWWKASKLIPPFQSLALWLRGQVPPDYASPFKSSTASQR
jgi:membrane protein required for colicin V production